MPPNELTDTPAPTGERSKNQIVAKIVISLTTSLLLCGCGKKQEESTPTPFPPGLEQKVAPPAKDTQAPATAASAPQNLGADAQHAADQAMALAKEGEYQEALVLLQQKLAEIRANPEAKSLIEQVIAQIKTMMADAALKSAAEKVGGNIGKSLGGFAK